MLRMITTRLACNESLVDGPRQAVELRPTSNHPGDEDTDERCDENSGDDRIRQRSACRHDS